jgi:hypothetical protein
VCGGSGAYLGNSLKIGPTVAGPDGPLSRADGPGMCRSAGLLPICGCLRLFGCNDRTGRDGTIPQICCLVQGQGLGQDYPCVVPSYPSKLEGRERTPGDVPVLAVPQPNTP